MRVLELKDLGSHKADSPLRAVKLSIFLVPSICSADQVAIEVKLNRKLLDHGMLLRRVQLLVLNVNPIRSELELLANEIEKANVVHISLAPIDLTELFVCLILAIMLFLTIVFRHVVV